MRMGGFKELQGDRDMRKRPGLSIFALCLLLLPKLAAGQQDDMKKKIPD